MKKHERRVHPRIQVSAELRVSGPKGVVTGTLVDLSKGGAGLILPRPVGEKGDEVELFLPFSGEVEITVLAEIVRTEATHSGTFVGLRFNLVEPALRQKLLGLIETLLKSRGSETRRYPRVARRLHIAYRQLDELKAILENISMGGLAMVVERPLVLYEDLEVTVPDIAGKDFLILPARVVHQHSEEIDGFTRYRVGLEFKELTTAATTCLRELLNNILELKGQTEKQS